VRPEQTNSVVLTFSLDTIQLIVNHFPQDGSNSHNPVLLPLYHQFLSTLFDVCSPFTKDPNELAYIAAARWPGFVAPILDEYRRLLDEAGDDGDGEDFELTAPTEDARIRLIRLFTPSFTTALETLYPRLSNAAEWAADNQPQQNLLSGGFSDVNLVVKSAPQTPQATLTDVLPRMSKFILLAAFLASMNPTKSDIRMFGRALQERKKRKRGAFSSARGGNVKVGHSLSPRSRNSSTIDSPKASRTYHFSSG
jgi:origin recognition complex subunit 5